MASSDIELLFGVAGEGKASGESGQHIRKQLEELMADINQKPLKVTVKLDAESSNKKSWSAQLQSKLNELSANNKFAIQISNLKIGNSALSDFKRQIGSVLDTLHLESGTSITLSAGNIGEITSQIKQSAGEAKTATREIAEFKVQMESLSGLKSSVRQVVKDLESANIADEERAKISEITAQYEQWAIKIEEVRASKEMATSEYRAELEAEGTAILSLANKTKESAEADIQNTTRLNNLHKQTYDLLTRVQKAQRDWKAAENGSASASYKNLDGYRERLEKIIANWEELAKDEPGLREALSGISREFSEAANEIRNADENTNTFLGRMGGLASKFTAWLSVTRVVMGTISAMKKMVKQSIELDDAMTQLRIVTNETEQAYQSYMSTISDTAQRIGSSISDLIDSTTTYARLGYSLEESSQLAEFTAMLQNVGDIDVSDAQDAITAIIKAFKDLSASDIESVMDKMVKVGNNFPISVSQIAEGMNNASSALAAAGNNFDQSVALLTAANTTIQNAAKSSTGLRTIAARLRNVTTELDDLGEVMTEASYQELVSMLTDANVSLVDTNGELRSTYDIVSDIAKIWDTLSPNKQAGLATAISGTRQQAVFFSLVEQFQEASGAMDAMATSAGTLQESYRTFMDSVTAHINQFKAAFQSLSQSTFTQEFLTNVIDIGTKLIGVLEKLMEVVNALGGMNTVLITTLSLLVAINSTKIIKAINNNDVVKGIKAICAQIKYLKTGSAEAAAAVEALGGPTAIFTAALTGAIAVLGVALTLYNRHKQEIQENRAAAISAAKEAVEENDEIVLLLGRYSELSDEIKTNQEVKDDLLSTQDELLEKLGMERSEIQGLQGDYAALTRTIRKRAIDKLNENAQKASVGVDNAKDDLVDKAKGSWSNGLYATSLNYISASWNKKNASANERALKALEQYGFRPTAGSANAVVFDFSELGEAFDLTTIDGITAAYKRLGNMMNVVFDTTGEVNSDIYKALLKRQDAISDELKTYTLAVQNANAANAQLDVQTALLESDLPKTEKEFRKLRVSIVAAAFESEKYNGTQVEIADAIDAVLKKTTGLEQFYKTAETGSQNLVDQTEKTILTIEQLGKALATIESDVNKFSSALKEFDSDGKISSKTFSDLAETFGKLDAFQGFIDIMSDSEATIEDVQNALEVLAGEYIDNTELLDNLTEENRALVAAQLEKIGVTNADEVVTYRLAKAEAQLAWDTAVAEGRVDDLIASLGNEASYSNAARTQLIQLAKQMILTNQTNMSLNEQITALKQIAIWAGVASGAVAAVGNASTPTIVKPSQLNRQGAVAITDSGTGTSGTADARQTLANMIDEATSAISNVKIDLSGYSGSGSSGGSGSKAVEAYIADIDKYREALKRLNEVQEERAAIEDRIANATDYKEQIVLQRELINTYEREQAAISELNRQRSATIQESAESLRELGFVVEYNAETNSLWIENLEHLNELKAQDQESTNALIQDTEDLINSLTDLNDANKEGAQDWADIANSISGAHDEIDSLLQSIVNQAGEAVDKIKNVYDTLHTAADEYVQTGYISIDTMRSVLSLGAEYMAYLRDENGQLVINEERIRDVIAAQVQQLALEQALTYIEALRIAKQKGDAETLNQLLYATEQTTDATWGLVYAHLGLLDLTGDEYNAALNNINALRAIADSAISGIGDTGKSVLDELNDMQSGLDDILKYVMDMLKQRISDQVDLLEDMKDAYADIIDSQKEALKLKKAETSYQKTLAEKMKEMAKLQAQIDALSLDDSREAQAQRAKLLEELAELQADLDDTQADHMYDAQTDALDKMQEAYEEEKDKEIDILNDSISSYQKLYDMAIDYIENHWDTLYDELIDWNYEYGSVLNDEITTAWENCLAAAQRYGSYVSALGSIGTDIESAQSSGSSLTVGNTNYDSNYSAEEGIRAVVFRMKENSRLWHTASAEERERLAAENKRLALTELPKYGVAATIGSDGVWYLSDGRKLYDVYHQGGVVGGGDLKANERIAVLKDKEWVLSEQMVDNLSRQIDMLNRLSNANVLNSFTPYNNPIQKLASEASRVGLGNGSHAGLTVQVPVQVQVLQRLDRQEIERVSDLIGKTASGYINESFRKGAITIPAHKI